MSSVNAAKRLGVYDRKGSIEVGKDADIVLVNDHFDVRFTCCMGRISSLMITSNHIKWIQVEDYVEMSKLAASIFVQQLLQKPNSVLGLATGGSPVGFYETLVQQYDQGIFSFGQATTFNLDEYIGIDSTHPTSYHSYMNEHLFAHIDIPVTQRHLPNGLAEEASIECERYEQVITASGGIDLQLLGIGVNGHIGFNEPGTSFHSKTHVVELADATRERKFKVFSIKRRCTNSSHHNGN